MANSKTYDKGSSILDFRGASVTRDELLKRIFSLDINLLANGCMPKDKILFKFLLPQDLQSNL